MIRQHKAILFSWESIWRFAVTLAVFGGGSVAAESLTLQERINALTAIERLAHGHRTGSVHSFDTVASRRLLDDRARSHLQKTQLLSRQWSVEITRDTLEQELERILRRSLMPARLDEMFGALGYRHETILEVIARPVLVDRLVHNLYHADHHIHADRRSRAEAVRRSLLAGAIPVDELLTVTPDSGPASTEENQLDGRLEFLATWPEGIGPVTEERAGFAVPVARREDDGSVVMTTYWIPKVSWSTWWAETRKTLDAMHVETVFTDGFPAGMVAMTTSTAPENRPFCLPDNTWDNGILGQGLPARSGHTAVWTGAEMIVWGGAKDPGGAAYNPALDTWRVISAVNAPNSLRGHTAVWTGHQMIVWGGSDGSDLVALGGLYDPVTDRWTATSLTDVPDARRYHTATWTGERMIIWGGANAVGSVDTGALFDPVLNRWSSISSAGVPDARSGHRAVWTGDRMIIWGGVAREGSTLLEALDSGGLYNPGTDTWTPTSVAGAPDARYLHTAVWTGSEMIIWGGYRLICNDINVYCSLGDGARYDPVTNAWSSMASSDAPGPRRAHTAVWSGTEMIIWGGATGSFVSTETNSGGRYDPSIDSWSPTAWDGAPERRLAHTTVWTGSEMIVWGGVTSDIGFPVDAQRSGGRYFAQENRWLPTGPPGPEGRILHAAHWTGTHMLVWGGQSFTFFSLKFLNTGYLYNPVLDTWNTMSDVNAPSGSVLFASVWTGSEMIVWGGWAPGQAKGDGSRYDPVIDRWETISMVNAPMRRTGHVAAWTGNEMVIWGGTVTDLSDPNRPVTRTTETGGRYDPMSDTWQPVTTTGAPDARSVPTAVWSGAEMIVWGGTVTDLSDPNRPVTRTTDTGGRYDPVLDIWRPMTNDGTLEGRHQHSAVWTGTEMIVWGGLDDGVDGQRLDTGARYDPVLDQWRPVSNINAPGERSSHAAAWSGSEMIVWGGWEQAFTTPPPPSTGGRYDPVLDRWNYTADAGAPFVAGPVSAVWTDGAMIVFGTAWNHRQGSGIYSDQSAGGRYGVRVKGAPDGDWDGLHDACDNCPNQWNRSQDDFDRDGHGDACETGAHRADVDGTGRVDGFDLARLGRAFGSHRGHVLYDFSVDLDHNHEIGPMDLTLLAASFGIVVQRN